MKKTQVARLLAYVTGIVNQQLLLQNELWIANYPRSNRPKVMIEPVQGLAHEIP
ncbi:MAG TPA: hypothetical protein VM715_07750 [Candidatus Acidoferrum sp.]|nr:hypothetical protein [Candidatus Acidoferrum sp.]